MSQSHEGCSQNETGEIALFHRRTQGETLQYFTRVSSRKKILRMSNPRKITVRRRRQLLSRERETARSAKARLSLTRTSDRAEKVRQTMAAKMFPTKFEKLQIKSTGTHHHRPRNQRLLIKIRTSTRMRELRALLQARSLNKDVSLRRPSLGLSVGQRFSQRAKSSKMNLN